MNKSSDTKRCAVVGASSGIGRATAERLARDGYHVLAVGRNRSKLEDLRAFSGREVQGRIDVQAADATDAAAMNELFARYGRFEHLVLTPSTSRGMGPIASIDLDELRSAFDGKYFAQVIALRAALPYLDEHGSITFITACSSGAAFPNTAGLAAVNGALDAMVPVLAVELAPRRVNAVSPGVVDTPWWDKFPAEQRDAFFASVSAKSPVRRVGTDRDLAHAIQFVIENSLTTGIVLRVDGGASLTP